MCFQSSRVPLLALIGLALSGCTETPEFKAALEAKITPPTSVELLGNGEAGEMAMYHKDQKVQVGDTWPFAAKVFPEPTRGTYAIRDLPYPFSEKFEAHGWETDRGEGFGVILNENKVIGAIYELENAHDDLVAGLEREQISGMYPLHPKLISSGSLKYWFWTSKDQITMMCAFTTRDGINFTLAMGDKNVMKALGVSEEDANKQKIEVDRLQTQPTVKLNFPPNAPAKRTT